MLKISPESNQPGADESLEASAPPMIQGYENIGFNNDEGIKVYLKTNSKNNFFL